jgi:hypothetical protein
MRKFSIEMFDVHVGLIILLVTACPFDRVRWEHNKLNISILTHSTTILKPSLDLPISGLSDTAQLTKWTSNVCFIILSSVCFNYYAPPRPIDILGGRREMHAGKFVDFFLYSGQSTWLQIQRPGFDFRRYQIFSEIVGLERGPLSLVSTTEELLERKVAAPV